MRWKKVMVVIMATLVSSGTARSRDYDWLRARVEWPPPDSFKPHFQLSFGADFRTDEYKTIKHLPTFHTKLYYFVVSSVAFKTGLGYNQATRYSFGAEVRTVVFDIGIRLQSQKKLISTFFETGMAVMRYTGNGLYAGLTETKPGVYIAIGAALKIIEQTSLDFTFSHTINHTATRGIILELYPGFIPPPPGHEYTTCRRYRFSESLYNPTTLGVMFRFRL